MPYRKDVTLFQAERFNIMPVAQVFEAHIPNRCSCTWSYHTKQWHPDGQPWRLKYVNHSCLLHRRMKCLTA